MNVDRKLIEECLSSFSPKELAAYERYVEGLLSNSLLMEEEAQEAACFRILQGRDGIEE